MSQVLVCKAVAALIALVGVCCASTLAKANELTRSQRLDNELSQIKALIRNGQSSDAIKILDAISNKSQGSSEYFFLRGRAMQELKNNTDALVNYSISVYLDKNNIRARINMALAKGALGDINGALRDLSDAAAMDPSNPVIPMNRGVTLAGLNRPKEAIREFDRAIQIDRKYSDAYRNRGIVRHFMKDQAGACRDWRQAASYGDEDTYQWVKFYCTKQPTPPSGSRSEPGRK